MIRARVRGFSVVELMVAMTLSLVMLAGVLSVVYSSKVTYLENERVARLQENGRTAVELIARDIRASGFRGCSRTAEFENTLNSPTDLLWDFQRPIQGFESTGAGSWTPTIDPVIVTPRDDSDVIAVRTVRPGQPTFRLNTAMASTTSDMELLPNGRTVLITDCDSAAAFALSGFVDGGATATLSHAAGGSFAAVGPGNSTGDISFDFQVGAQIAPVDTVIYYIRDSAIVRGGVSNPSLWRIVGAANPEELIEGVESVQVQYGVDTDGDRLVNSYQTADAVADWTRVISVSVAMLIRSVEPNAPEIDSTTYTLLGTNVGPFNDRYERTVFTTTVALRNTTS
jgi:type IV pilus assembly protein PilW